MSVLGNVKMVKRCKDTDSFCFFPIFEKKSYLYERYYNIIVNLLINRILELFLFFNTLLTNTHTMK